MREIEIGQDVYSSDGERVGRVLAATAHALVIEKGFFLPTDYACPRGDVAFVRDGAVHLSRTRAEVERNASSPDLAADAARAGPEMTAAAAQAMAEAGGGEIAARGQERSGTEVEVPTDDWGEEESTGRPPAGEGSAPHA